MHGAVSKSSDKCFHCGIWRKKIRIHWHCSEACLMNLFIVAIVVDRLKYPFSASMPVHKSDNAIQAISIPFRMKMCYARASAPHCGDVIAIASPTAHKATNQQTKLVSTCAPQPIIIIWSNYKLVFFFVVFFLFFDSVVVCGLEMEKKNKKIIFRWNITGFKMIARLLTFPTRSIKRKGPWLRAHNIM